MRQHLADARGQSPDVVADSTPGRADESRIDTAVARTARFEADNSRESVSEMRERARSALSLWHLPVDVARDAVLAVSELVSNVVIHTGDPVTLCLTFTEGEQLLIEVTDTSPRTPRARPASDDDPLGGQGLNLVAAVSRDWGYTCSGDAKTVWCRLDATRRYWD